MIFFPVGLASKPVSSGARSAEGGQGAVRPTPLVVQYHKLRLGIRLAGDGRVSDSEHPRSAVKRREQVAATLERSKLGRVPELAMGFSRRALSFGGGIVCFSLPGSRGEMQEPQAEAERGCIGGAPKAPHRTGALWNDLPSDFGPCKTVDNIRSDRRPLTTTERSACRRAVLSTPL